MLFDELVRIKVILSVKFNGLNSFLTLGGAEILVQSLAERTVLILGHSTHVVIQIFFGASLSPSGTSNRSTSIEVLMEGPEDARHGLLLIFNNDVALMGTLVISVDHNSLILLPNLLRFLHHNLRYAFPLVRYLKLH